MSTFDSRNIPLCEPTEPPDEWNRSLRLNPERSGLPTWQAIRSHNLTIGYRLAGGGDESMARMANIASVVAIQIELEMANARAIAGYPLPKEYPTLAMTLAKLLKAVGVDTPMKDVTPLIEQYIARRNGTDVATVGDVPAWMRN